MIRDAPGVFETDDILEMVNADLVKITVADRYLANFWKQIFPGIVVREDLTVDAGNDIAFAFRKDSPQLAAALNPFMDAHRGDTTFGKQQFKKYLMSTKWVKHAADPEDLERFHRLTTHFQRYGQEYNIDWLLMVAQGYQESRLNQNAKSAVGAIGVMQIMPATGKELQVGSIHVEQNNIRGGIKYVRQTIDRYYANEPMTELNKGLFAFAAYNAGPGRVNKLRKEAAKLGLDPNVWFNNVERVASQRIGRETVQYVSNIYKYYIAYSLIRAQGEANDAEGAASGGWRPADAGRTARAPRPRTRRAPPSSVSAMVCPSPPRRPGRHARNAPPDLRFRIAAKSDCDVILRALQELAASLGVPERLRSTRAGLERHGFGERPEFEVMLAEDDGGFAGMCLYFPFFSTWVGEPGIYVQDLYVAAARRGAGIGERLLREVARRGQANGYTHLRLTVDDGNAGGAKFYHRLGFERSPDEYVHKLAGDGFLRFCHPDAASG